MPKPYRAHRAYASFFFVRTLVFLLSNNFAALHLLGEVIRAGSTSKLGLYDIFEAVRCHGAKQLIALQLGGYRLRRDHPLQS
jgi:hypothetical protein